GACAHAPEKPAQPQILNSPLGSFVAPEGVTVVSAPPAAAPAPEAAPGAVSASTSLVAADPVAPLEASGQSGATAPEQQPAPAPGPTQVAGLDPAQYGDLFDRIRAGFRLEDGSEHAAVGQQLRWYASSPDYLQRAFGRADLSLYYIVTELERRGMPLELALLP